MRNYLHHVVYTLAGLLAVATVVFGGVTVDIQMHDVYYIVELRFLTIPALLVLLLQGAVYHWMCRRGKFPNLYLAMFYFASTMISVVGMLLVIFEITTTSERNTYYYYSSLEPMLLIKLLMLYGMSQLGYLLSIIMATRSVQIKNKKTSAR